MPFPDRFLLASARSLRQHVCEWDWQFIQIGTIFLRGTPMGITVDILIVVALIVANGVFAMAEIAVVSAKKARLKKLADEGDARAQAALELSNSPNRFLSTVQVGITLIGILAGAFGGATIADKLVVPLKEIPLLAPYAQGIAVGTVVAAITLLSLVIGELVPKRLGLNNPEGIAMRMARPMNRLSRMTAPVVTFLGACTDGMLKLLGVKLQEEQPVSPEEVRLMIEQGLHAGVFKKIQKDMVEGVFRLDQRYASDLMTPRARIVWLDIDDSDEANWRKVVASAHSSFPVYRENRDNVLGMVTVKALWANKALADHVVLKNLLTEPLFVPGTMPSNKLLEMFKQTGKHVALVTDEFGGIQGLISILDVMEAIVGELPSKEHPRKSLVTAREDGSLLCDALLEVDPLKELLKVSRLPGEGDSTFHTLGGFLLHHLGHIPREGEYIDHGAFRFEVMDMDRHRIDKVLIVNREKSPTNKTS
ncbi:MAG: hemolysin family protein [Verrucomicrobiota bacterium]